MLDSSEDLSASRTSPDSDAATPQIRHVPSHARLRDHLRPGSRGAGRIRISPPVRALAAFWGGAIVLSALPGAHDAWIALVPFGAVVAAVLRSAGARRAPAPRARRSVVARA
jgi:hypothetical protein